MKVCPKCGKTYETTQVFCNADGTLLSSAVNAVAVAETKNNSWLIYPAIGVLMLILGGGIFGWVWMRANAEIKSQETGETNVITAGMKAENEVVYVEKPSSKSNENKETVKEKKYERATEKKDVANPEAFGLIIAAPQMVKICQSTIESCGQEILSKMSVLNQADNGKGSNQNREEVFYFQNGVAVYLRTLMGLADDSVNGVRYRVAFKKNGERYEFVQAGRQQQCYSGRGSARWTKVSCY